MAVMLDDEQQPDSNGDNPPEDLELEGYVLQREISRGGQAIIFSAIKKSTGRKVAVKFFPGGSFATRKEKVRMDREVRVLAALDHPNIVSVIDRGQTADGSTYFVLEYVRGKTLAEFIDDFWEQQGRPKTVDELKPLLHLFVRIADAINAAHLRGVVHRDLKPSNIVIDSYGEPHVLDFGVALSSVPLMDDAGDALPSVTWTGEFLGSVQWASPEQAEGDQTKIDVRSDVYSLGIILYEALTGDFPYDVFGSLPNVLKNIMTAKPRPPSEIFRDRHLDDTDSEDDARECPIDTILDGIVLKALAKNRADRYQTAGEFSKAISSYLTGHTVSLRNPLLPRKRWPLIAGAGALAILLAIAASWLTRWQLQRTLPPPAETTPPSIEAPRFQAVNVFGYLIDNDDVVFDFDPRDYDFARMADGSLGLVESISSITRVSLAGPFNEWDPLDSDWIMRRTVRDRFQLRIPLTNFAGRREWPFKFVINDRIWVSAPTAADNKEVVIEDTATYNLIFVNPLEEEDELVAGLRTYRAQINAAWPGQSENLVQDGSGGLHLTLTRMDPSTRIISLDVLENIPLSSLHLGQMRITGRSSLGQMTNLHWFVCGDDVFYSLFSEMLDALADDDIQRAREGLDRDIQAFRGVPAFDQTYHLLASSLDGLIALEQDPDMIPPTAIEFEDRQYLWVPTPMNWQEARAFAEDHGATLAAILSEGQQTWMTQQFGWPSLGREVWLGGTDEMVRGSWGWLTGDDWSFQNWFPGYPDRVDDQARAIAMQYDGWWVNQNPLAHERPFLIVWQ